MLIRGWSDGQRGATGAGRRAYASVSDNNCRACDAQTPSPPPLRRHGDGDSSSSSSSPSPSPSPSDATTFSSLELPRASEGEGEDGSGGDTRVRSAAAPQIPADNYNLDGDDAPVHDRTPGPPCTLPIEYWMRSEVSAAQCCVSKVL